MPCFPLHGAVNLSLGFFCLLFVSNLGKEQSASTKGEIKKDERVAVLATAELPAKSLDLAAINLTDLVNGMLNSALKGTRKFISLLSITSYSSYAFHKVSIVVYNISNLKNIDPTKFPTRYCYCLTNRTNDLTDFTALLVDIIGNYTSSLTEIFKSTSILSVSHSNDTDCVYICVMSGRTGRNLSDLWEAVEKSPVINYTFSGNMSDLLDLDSVHPNLIHLREEAEKVQSYTAHGAWTFKTTKMPMRAQTGSLKGAEMHLTQRPMWLKTMSSQGPYVPAPFWLHTDIWKGPDVLLTKTTSVGPPPPPPSPPLVEGQDISSRGPPVPTPKLSVQPQTVVPKGDETVLPRLTTWRKMVGSKGSGTASFQVSSWLQAGASNEWEIAPTKLVPSPASMTSHDVPPGTQPVPTTGVPLPLASPSTEEGPDLLKTTEASVVVTWPTSSRTTRAPMQTGNLALLAVSTPPQRTSVFPKVYSRCPKAPKRETAVTLPAATAVAPKINPCVMELCKFFQQCLCMRQRRYSREESMRYCMENYSWFLKNAAYVCERVKRMSYSSTLKQKCLTSICKSI